LADAAAALAEALDFDGVMLGRAAWHNPRVLSELTMHWWPQAPLPDDGQVVQAMVDYAARRVAEGVPLRVVVRPLLGLLNGQPGARRWRRALSDPGRLATNDPGLIRQAWVDAQPRAA